MSLTDKNKTILADTVKKIEQNDFGHSEIITILVTLRYENSSQLYDLANFITHPGERNQGRVHKASVDFVNRITEEMKNGYLNGAINKPVYTEKEIISEILSCLYKLNIPANSARIKSMGSKILSLIMDLIDQTNVIISVEGINKCWLTKNENQRIYVNVELNHKLDNRLIRMDEKSTVIIATSLF